MNQNRPLFEPGSDFVDYEIVTMHEKSTQHRLAGRDTETDAMAAVLVVIDSASASIGFPIRNIHKISEFIPTQDGEAAIRG